MLIDGLKIGTVNLALHNDKRQPVAPLKAQKKTGQIRAVSWPDWLDFILLGAQKESLQGLTYD